MYELGETITLSVVVTDKTGTEFTPASTTISIRAPDKSMTHTDTPMSEDAAGEFHFDYAIPAEPNGIVGKYLFKIEAVGFAGKVTIATGNFDVVKSI